MAARNRGGAVLLDVYGTLVHDDELVAQVCARVAELADVGVAAVADEWWSRICAAADLAHGDAFRRLADLNRSSLTETLAHFGVCADAAQLRQAQMDIVVEAAVTSEDARAYKPRPEPFQLALAHLGVEAEEVVHVGDSPLSDVAGAGALGIDTAFVSRGERRLPADVTATHTLPRSPRCCRGYDGAAASVAGPTEAHR